MQFLYSPCFSTEKVQDVVDEAVHLSPRKQVDPAARKKVDDGPRKKMILAGKLHQTLEDEEHGIEKKDKAGARIRMRVTEELINKLGT